MTALPPSPMRGDLSRPPTCSGVPVLYTEQNPARPRADRRRSLRRTGRTVRWQQKMTLMRAVGAGFLERLRDRPNRRRRLRNSCLRDPDGARPAGCRKAGLSGARCGRFSPPGKQGDGDCRMAGHGAEVVTTEMVHFRMARLGRASPFPRRPRADQVDAAATSAARERGGSSYPPFRPHRAAAPSRPGQLGAAAPRRPPRKGGGLRSPGRGGPSASTRTVSCQPPCGNTTTSPTRTLGSASWPGRR